MLKALKANFDAINICQLTIHDILRLPESFKDFIDVYKQSIIRIIENGYNNDFENGPLAEEMKELWIQIYQLC